MSGDSTRPTTPLPSQGEAEEQGGFLGRWSRLKQGRQEPVGGEPARLPATSVPASPDMPQALPPSPGDPASSAGETPASAGDEASQRELDELLASLPKLEEIGATTDVTGFMHRLVPDALRNAALRAAWSADPGIRDFLNDAREYALDYNTPGAAYGYGPLSESDLAGLDDMVRGIFGDTPKQMPLPGHHTLDEGQTGITNGTSDTVSQGPDAAPQQNAADEPPASAVRLSEPAATQQESPVSPEELLENIPKMQPQVEETSLVAVRHDGPDPTATPSEHSTYRRRGGGAMPV
jgi:Protein of unknown function (DUF3306)